MSSTPQHAAIYIPPPVIGLGVFGLAVLMQKYFPISKDLLQSSIFSIVGYCFVSISLIFGLSGVYRFWKTGNTVETFKRANSLQTTGMYAYSRNPMYVGLVCMYIGISILIKNIWVLAFVVLFIFLLRYYVIRREENYLIREFGEQYINYKKRVHRWIGKKKL